MKKILHKIILLAVIPTLLIGLGAGLMFFFLTTGSKDSSVFAYEETMRADYDTLAKYQVTVAISAADFFYQKHEAGELTFEEAKAQAADILSKLRYKKGGYFWADNQEGVCVVSVLDKYIGTQRLDMEDSDGKLIIQEFLKKGKQGGGFSDYRFPKENDSVPLPKRSYVQLYEPFGWTVGTGNYVDDIDRKAESFKSKQERNVIIMFGVLLLLLLTSFTLIIIYGRKISKPVESLTQNAKELAQGNLRTEIKHFGQDEIGILADSLRIMVKKLTEITTAIKQEATQTENAGNEMLSASSKISQSASQLAATVEEAASALEEVMGNTDKMNEESEKAQRITQIINEEAMVSADVTRRTAKVLTEVMKEISIVGEIAFQTNLLALNAAIQASKAGAKGKGFGVIAEQIRQLATDSSEASTRIEKMSNKGIAISRKSKKMLTNMLPRIEKATGMIASVSKAAGEQKESIRQINHQISELNNLAQQNASVAEETDANASELNKQAALLPKIISFFKL